MRDREPDVPVLLAADERLSVAVENLLENAVEHHPATGCEESEGPHVRVSIDDSADERVAIRVGDDGAGIPEHEREVVAGETEITPLQHASGLGLWLVAWIVSSSARASSERQK